MGHNSDDRIRPALLSDRRLDCGDAPSPTPAYARWSLVMEFMPSYRQNESCILRIANCRFGAIKLATRAGTNKLELLEKASLLRGLADHEISRIAPFVQVRRYRNNQVIFRKGDDGDSLMIVAEGKVKIRSTSLDGREIILNIIDTGEVFGEIAMLDGQERTGDAIAVGEVSLLAILRRDVVPIIRRHPEVSVRLMYLLCERLRRTSEQVEDLVFLVQSVRLAKTLLRLARQFGLPGKDSVAIELKMSQRELGSLVGMRREALNRQLVNWRRDGLIDLSEGRIVIVDVPAFERLLDSLIE